MADFIGGASKAATAVKVDDDVDEIDTLPLQYIALNQWWQRHNKSFCEWILLGLTNEQREALLIKACPDMPLVSSIARKQRATDGGSIILSATDKILPELSLDSLLACEGKILVLLFTRRCTAMDYCLGKDIEFIDRLYHSGNLPDFSQGALKSFDTPFVDPSDPSERVQALDSSTSPEMRAIIEQKLQTGKLVRADVWLAVRIRRLNMASFMMNLATSHQSGVEHKPSPTLQALFDAELQQYQAGLARLQEYRKKFLEEQVQSNLEKYSDVNSTSSSSSSSSSITAAGTNNNSSSSSSSSGSGGNNNNNNNNNSNTSNISGSGSGVGAGST